MYVLDRDQIATYGSFRRGLRRALDKMVTRKAPARLDQRTIPREFESFCTCLVMGMKYAGSTPKEWVQYAVNASGREHSQAALRFFDRIACQNP